MKKLIKEDYQNSEEMAGFCELSDDSSSNSAAEGSDSLEVDDVDQNQDQESQTPLDDSKLLSESNKCQAQFNL